MNYPETLEASEQRIRDTLSSEDEPVGVLTSHGKKSIVLLDLVMNSPGVEQVVPVYLDHGQTPDAHLEYVHDWGLSHKTPVTILHYWGLQEGWQVPGYFDGLEPETWDCCQQFEDELTMEGWVENLPTLVQVGDTVMLVDEETLVDPVGWHSFLGDWDDSYFWRYIGEHDLDTSPLYRDGAREVGCNHCIDTIELDESAETMLKSLGYLDDD